MPRIPRLLTSALTAAARRLIGRTADRPPKADRRQDNRRHDDRRDDVLEDSPGQSGAAATVEVDADQVGSVRMSYAPQTDGEPDPGEVVWTWVPFEENDGRGKDRPVLLVAAEPAGTLLGVQLTSKKHSDSDYVPVGAGGWDSEHRPSWAKLDRLIRVHPDGMRREGTALARDRFDTVAAALRKRYGFGAGQDGRAPS